MKRFLSALALLLTFGFMLSANAAELTVTGAEAKDLYLFGDEMMKATLSMSPCINKYKSQTSDTYKLFYTCICKNREMFLKFPIVQILIFQSNRIIKVPKFLFGREQKF